MKLIKTAGLALLGLFVDDGRLALVILALLGILQLLTTELQIDQESAAVTLVAGTFIALVENVLRTAREKAR